ncbi:MAG: hypothetical protein LBU29_01675 [Endomicrobium sp.]|jgi:hypothetical protein|nr:hypothetical protein [Endomicrobium sp.]
MKITSKIEELSKKIKCQKIKADEKMKHACNAEGLFVGGIIGLSIGVMFFFDILFSMELGMFLGLIVESRQKKKKDNSV